METWELLIDSNRGIFVPKSFAKQYGHYLEQTDANKANLEILKAGPDHEDYWEAWEDVLGCELTNEQGEKFTLHHDSDLWAVPADFDWETFESF